MTTRDELKNVAYAELTEQGYLPTSKTDRMAVVDVVVDAALADLRAKAGKLPRRYRKEHGKWLITVDVADLTALFDGAAMTAEFVYGLAFGVVLSLIVMEFVIIWRKK